MVLVVDKLRLLLQHLQVVLPARLGHDPFRAIARLRRQCGQDTLFVDGRVPDVKVRHPRIVAHVLAVTRYRRACRILARRLVAAEKARRHESAGSKTFQVPFPRSGQRLVEIVDRKNEVTLRRCEHAEISDVCIPAGLHWEARYRRVRQVARHDGRRPAQKRKGLTSIRAWRMGTRKARRVFACSSRMATGSCRSDAGRYSACSSCGTSARMALPAAMRSSTDGRGALKSVCHAACSASVAGASANVFPIADSAQPRAYTTNATGAVLTHRAGL